MMLEEPGESDLLGKLQQHERSRAPRYAGRLPGSALPAEYLAGQHPPEMIIWLKPIRLLLFLIVCRST